MTDTVTMVVYEVRRPDGTLLFNWVSSDHVPVTIYDDGYFPVFPDQWIAPPWRLTRISPPTGTSVVMATSRDWPAEPA